MANMFHQVTIGEHLGKVSWNNNRRRVDNWWTADTEAEPCEGAVTIFGFFNRAKN
jgi:hypothetical protein